MTYNVNFGGAGMDQAVAAIANADADVVCLQETTPAWEQELRRALSGIYPHMEFRHSGGAGGQAFLSKHELQELAYVSETPGWFPGWIVRAKTPLGVVQVVNVHLRPPLSDRGSATPSAYLGTGSIRREEVRLLSEKMDDATPTLMIGDFNENDSGKAVSWLRQHGFTDALRQFDGSANTWQWRTSVITLRGRYDHVLYSHGLTCADARVIRKGASDHFPVVAVITRHEGN
jgi:endonuclease/exonuclease/phosphatase family metal-dependent hydrolase